VRRVRIALREKGLACEEIVVATPGVDTREPAFRRMNPLGRIPTLEDGDLVLGESGAILEYLEERHPAPPLLPGDLATRARVRELMRAADAYFVPPLFLRYVKPRLQTPAAEWDRADMAAAVVEIGEHLDVLEQRLASRDHLAGAFSLADVAYAPFVVGLERLRGGQLVAARPRVRAWIERLADRPSVRETAP
jgi:glutathione S-transferase